MIDPWDSQGAALKCTRRGPFITGMNSTRALLWFLVIASFFLAACNQVETAIPIAASPAGRVTNTPEPRISTITPVMTSITLFPNRTPEYTYLQDEGSPIYPLAGLRILSPGEGSRLVSPIQPELSVLLGVENTIEVELLNSSGVLLGKKLIRYSDVDATRRILIKPLMPFEIDAGEETGRLVVKTLDASNRLIALASCDLTLLSSGENEKQAADVPYESFLITEPGPGDLVQGGVLTVAGYARPVSQSAIVIELIDESGKEVANRILFLDSQNSDIPTVFSTTLPYQIDRETPVRLIIRQTKGAIPGPAVAFSFLLTIK